MGKGLFKQLGKDSLTYGVMGVFTKIIGVALLPIYTRVFSTNQFGYLDIFLTFTTLFAMTSSLALPSSLLRYYKNDNTSDDKQLYSTLIGFSVFINSIVFFAIIIFSSQLSYLLTKSYDYINCLKMTGAAAIFLSVGRMPEILLRRQRKIVLYSILNVSRSVVYALFALLFVLYYKMGLEGVLLGFLIASILKLFLGLAFSYKSIVFVFNKKKLKKSLKYSLPMFPAVFVSWANEQLNRIILLFFTGPAGVGLFAAGARISNIISLFTNIFRKAWDPLAVEIIQKKEDYAFFARVLKYYIGGFAIIGLGISFFAYEILYVLLEKEYHSALTVIPWLIGAVVINDGGNLINIGSVISEKTAVNSIAAWSGLVVNILVTVILVYFIGFYGAAIGAFLSQIIAKSILWSQSVKLAKVDFNVAHALKVLIIYTILNILMILIYFQVTEYSYSLLLRVSLLLLSILLIFKITKDEEMENMIKSLKTKKLVKVN